MTQNNFRKEPTFGEPSVATSHVENNAAAGEATKSVAPSLHTTTSPGHTFTPHLKRPEAAATEAQKVAAEEVKEVKAEPQKPAGFTFEPVREKAEQAVEKAESVAKTASESVKSTAQEAAKVAAATAERVIPTAATKPESKPVVAASKGRRIGLVALLAAILGAVFFWLKPSTPETVEELQQQQGGSLPIEFRPVDEAEAQRAEAQAQAEREAAAQQAQQAQTQPATPADNAQQPAPTAQPAATTPEPMAQTPAVETPAPSTATETITAAQPQAQVQAEPVKAVVKPEVHKPKTQGSVIHQAEHKPAKPQIKAMTAEEFNAKKSKNAQMDQLVKNVESGKAVPKTAATQPAKPTTPAKAAAPAAAAPAASSQAVSSKTMTVPKSTSLMQVFRDHQLNISDVNAMSKANGIVSKLKENEKVTVRLDKNNRVVEMTIGSGGKFTRQADGTYSFK